MIRQIGIYKDPFYSTNGCPKCGYINEVKYYNIKLTPAKLWDKQDKGFVVQCMDEGLTGAISDGETEDEAVKNIIEAIQGIEETRNKK